MRAVTNFTALDPKRNPRPPPSGPAPAHRTKASKVGADPGRIQRLPRFSSLRQASPASMTRRYPVYAKGVALREQRPTGTCN